MFSMPTSVNMTKRQASSLPWRYRRRLSSISLILRSTWRASGVKIASSCGS